MEANQYNFPFNLCDDNNFNVDNVLVNEVNANDCSISIVNDNDCNNSKGCVIDYLSMNLRSLINSCSANDDINFFSELNNCDTNNLPNQALNTYYTTDEFNCKFGDSDNF